MIAIVDYGAGNLVSVKKALDLLGQECVITSDPAEVEIVPRRSCFQVLAILPSTASLARSGLQDAIAGAIRRGVPFLGICVGMQWMLEGSQESPETRGLGLLPGECERFPADVKSPHVGWNQLEIRSVVATVSRFGIVVVRIFHAFVSCSAEQRDRGLL